MDSDTRDSVYFLLEQLDYYKSHEQVIEWLVHDCPGDIESLFFAAAERIAEYQLKLNAADTSAELYKAAEQLASVISERNAFRDEVARLEGEVERLRVEMAYRDQGQPPYMPQSLCMEIMDRLDQTYTSLPGEGNTVWAMVYSVCRELDAAREEVERLEGERDAMRERVGEVEWRDGPPPGPGIWWVRDSLDDEPPWVAFVYVRLDGDYFDLAAYAMCVMDDYSNACPVHFESVAKVDHMFVRHAAITTPRAILSATPAESGEPSTPTATASGIDITDEQMRAVEGYQPGDDGLSLGMNERWEQGIPHNPESERIFGMLKDADSTLDYFCWKYGGDGDNGETLMYELDVLFAATPAESGEEAPDMVKCTRCDGRGWTRVVQGVRVVCVPCSGTGTVYQDSPTQPADGVEGNP